MTTRKKLLLMTVLSVVCFLVILAGAVGGYAAYLKRTTNNLRRDLSLLMQKQSSLAEVQNLSLKYARFRSPFRFFITTQESHFIIDPNSCTRQQCGVAFTIDNDLIAKLGIVKPSEFSSTIVVLDDHVAYLEMSLFGGPTGLSGGIVEFVPCCSEISRLIGSSEPYSFPIATGKPYLIVRMTDGATQEQLRQAAALDTHCFLARSSCDWPCHYLPSAWKDYARQLPSEDIDYWRSKGMNCPEDGR
jgi:hypothetical protein